MLKKVSVIPTRPPQFWHKNVEKIRDNKNQAPKPNFFSKHIHIIVYLMTILCPAFYLRIYL